MKRRLTLILETDSARLCIPSIAVFHPSGVNITLSAGAVELSEHFTVADIRMVHAERTGQLLRLRDKIEDIRF